MSDMSPRRVLAPALLALAAVAAMVAAPAGAADPLPVPYTVLTPTALLAEPPGSNDPECRPSTAHPRPVVLLHGLGGNQSDNMSTLSPLLKNNGYCVFSLTYGAQPVLPLVGGLQDLDTSGPVVARFVKSVLLVTGAKQVDLVGHSEGTVMSRWLLRYGGLTGKVRTVVGLTPLWDGTTLGPVALLSRAASGFGLDPLLGVVTGLTCDSCRDLLTGSQFLEDLNTPSTTVKGVRYTNVVTRYDQLVIPYTSGLLEAPGVTNIVLQDSCPLDLADHIGVAFSPNAGQHVLRALDPASAKPFRCVPNTPLGGLSP